MEILGFAMPKMSYSHLLNIREGGFGDVNKLPVYKVCKKFLIGLPPVLGCLCWYWQNRGECGMMWLWVVACGWAGD